VNISLSRTALLYWFSF